MRRPSTGSGRTALHASPVRGEHVEPPFETVSKAALILAPFTSRALDTLGLSLQVTYESWTETRKLYAPEELAGRINKEHISILVVEADFVFDEVFREAPGLEFLGVCRNSLDHIDLEAATEAGVLVVNTPGRNANAVAELTLGLMLCLARRLPSVSQYVREGRWEDPVAPYIEMRGTELRGKTLGILGLGTIGRSVAGLATAFGMKVIAYDPGINATDDRVDAVRLDSLENVLEAADFLSIHTPDTSCTEGLLDETRLAHLKVGAYIINTASYHAIDEEALVSGIRSGRIAGAALDVHRTHPILPTSPLKDLEQVILTPHIGGATSDTVACHSRMMTEDIGRYLQRQKPHNLVNPSAWRQRG